jgi:O-antigen/teichoic acid export membrane protein
VSLSNFFDTVICLSIVKTIPDSQLMAAYPFVSFLAEDEKAIWLFGVYQGLCLSVVNLIPSLSSAIGSSGLPYITRSIYSNERGQLNQQANRLFKLTAFLVVPVSLFVAFFPEEVLITLYGDRGAQIDLATYFLRFMAPVAILSAFSFPLNSILHARKKSDSILKILIFACGVKVILSYKLCSVGQINLMGCIVSQIVFHCIVFILSVIAVTKDGQGISVIPQLIVPVSVSYLLLTFLRIFADFVLYTVPTVFRTFFCGGIFVLVYVTIFLFIGFFVDNSDSK